MAIEIRKLPKWEESKIEDKLLILKQQIDHNFFATLIFISTILGIVIATHTTNPGILDKIILILLVIVMIISTGMGLFTNRSYTRRVD